MLLLGLAYTGSLPCSCTLSHNHQPRGLRRPDLRYLPDVPQTLYSSARWRPISRPPLVRPRSHAFAVGFGVLCVPDHGRSPGLAPSRPSSALSSAVPLLNPGGAHWDAPGLLSSWAEHFLQRALWRLRQARSACGRGACRLHPDGGHGARPSLARRRRNQASSHDLALARRRIGADVDGGLPGRGPRSDSPSLPTA